MWGDTCFLEKVYREEEKLYITFRHGFYIPEL